MTDRRRSVRRGVIEDQSLAVLRDRWDWFPAVDAQVLAVMERTGARPAGAGWLATMEVWGFLAVHQTWQPEIRQALHRLADRGSIERWSGRGSRSLYWRASPVDLSGCPPLTTTDDAAS